MRWATRPDFFVYLFRANCNSAPSDPQLEAATRGRFEHTAIERRCDETAVVLPLALRPTRPHNRVTVPDTTPTPVGTPTTRPVVTVDSSQRLSHVIHFADEATPTRKAKPSGVMGAGIWVKVGDPPPVDPDELKFLGLDTRTPYTAKFQGAEANKVAHYMVRWVSTRGEKGPWSETASATIGA